MYFKERKEFYKIFIINRNSHFSDKILTLCKKHDIYKWKNFDNPDKELSELYFLFASSGSMRIINEWILNDCSIPVERLQEILDAFSLYGLSALKKYLKK